MFLLILIFFFQSCSIENGWKDIKSLKSNKVSVEKILGKPKNEVIGYYEYDTKETSFHIKYSTEPCIKNWGGRGDYDVPKDTVIEYMIFPKNFIKLDNLKFKRKDYIKVERGQEYFDFEYINDADGISIMTKIDNDVEYVYRIYFEPRIKSIGNRKCKTIEDK